MAAVHTHRRALGSRAPAYVDPAPGVTVPDAYVQFKAADLSAASVASWPNAGPGGSAYNLAPAGGQSAPARVASGGPNGGSYVRFVGNDVLATGAATGIANNAPRTLFLVVRLETPATARNLAGLGAASSSSLLDVIAGASYGAYYLHFYGSGAGQSAGAPDPAGWHLVGLTGVSGAGNGSIAFTGYTNGVKTLDAPARAIGTTNSPLRLGGGFYPDLNANNSPLQLAFAELHNVALSAQQMQKRSSQLLSLYNLS